MKRFALLLPLVLLLAACDTVNDSWHDVFGGGAQKPLGPGHTSGCPQVATIRDLSVYQNPPAAQESNLVINARMGHIQGGCTANEAGVNVNATVDFVALRGINSASTHASLPFFVSVVDAKDTVISKKVYEVPIDFEGASREVRITSPIEAAFDLKPGEDGSTYRVLIGFHLTPEQINANAQFFAQLPNAKQP